MTYESDEIQDILAALVERSLVIYDDESGRYRLLETVRQYAQGMLQQAGESESWRDRHLAFFTQLAGEANPALTGADQARWLDRLDLENDNLRSALEWAASETRDPAALGLLAGDLAWYWNIRSHLQEGRRWLEAAVRQADALDVENQALIYFRAAVLAHAQSDYVAARSYYQESLIRFEKQGKQTHIAWCLGSLAAVSLEEGDLSTARQMAGSALSHLREIGQESGIASVARLLGEVATQQHDLPIARSSFEESLSLFQKLGDDYAVARVEHGMGDLCRAEGDRQGARRHLCRSLIASVRLGQKSLAASCLDSLAVLELDEHRAELAARLMGAASGLREAAGAAIMPVVREEYERVMASVRSQLGAAGFEAAWQAGAAMSLEEVGEFASAAVCSECE